MKKLIFSLLVSTCVSNLCLSQDVITKKSSEDIQAKILEVTTTEIKYKKYDNQSGPTFSILKTDVLMVRYENGTKDIFVSEKTSNDNHALSEDAFRQGEMDAIRYYKGYKGAGTGTLITSLLIPVAGLIPAIVCSSTEPKEENLNYPSSNLMKDKNYNAGYSQKAKKIKSGKVWKNFGIGAGIAIVVVLMAAGN